MITNNNLTKQEEVLEAITNKNNKVLEYDLDAKRGSVAKVLVTNEDGTVSEQISRLHCGYLSEDDGIPYLLSNGESLDKHLGVQEYLNKVYFANAVTIDYGDNVAILFHSKEKNLAHVKLFKAETPKKNHLKLVVFSEK